ncbi:hypothetical protein KDH83_07960, partial [Achromobacter sp. Marseille-Q0513]|nr:hypothetical protein [Achromobacter sp. Marseille-Q0513]
MLAAGHVNGLGWDGGNTRGRRARAWVAALLACALHVGIGSLIWRGMAPVPIAPAMPSDSESMFVELLAPPTPRAERGAPPRGESRPVAAPAQGSAQGSVKTPAADAPRAQPERAEPSRAQPSPTPTNTQKSTQTSTQPAAAQPRVQPEPRAGKPADAPSAAAPAPRDFGWQPSDSAGPGERRARGEPVPRLAPKAPAERTVLSREMEKAARPPCRDAHASKGLLALPFLLADTVTD